MKIAIVILEFPSINETFILDHITGLIDRGHEVHIYATAPKGEPKSHDEIEIYKLLERTVYRDSAKFKLPRNRLIRAVKAAPLFGKGLLNNLTGTLNCLNVLRLGGTALSLSALFKAAPFITESDGEYDIVHCHFPENGELAVTMRDIGAIRGKVITSFHGYNRANFVSGQMWRLYGNLANKCDLFLVCSEHMKQWFEQNGWGREKTLVHRYGIHCNRFVASESRQNNSAQLRLLSVGRLVEKKGFEYAIRAVAKACRSFPAIRYEIVGDGPDRPKLEQLIDDLGAAAHITLLGWQERKDVSRLFEQARLFLAPSVTSQDGDQEGIPLVLHEAMASGLPIISTRHTGIPELVEEGQSGFLVAERDSEAIADKLTQLIEHPEIWHEMGQRGRKHIEEYNHIEKQTDRLVQIYRLLLEERFPLPQDRGKTVFDSRILEEIHG